ncbi:unnamed protein product [Schistosoma mattheei]|uniref:Uncharacterized protein n=1 Tax=Schistosoma mattheei TaxID=31246 RepID=A0A3P8B2K8_9TREM|nr:unnamed protein product [Schistosoma mattheei]
MDGLIISSVFDKPLTSLLPLHVFIRLFILLFIALIASTEGGGLRD